MTHGDAVAPLLVAGAAGGALLTVAAACAARRRARSSALQALAHAHGMHLARGDVFRLARALAEAGTPVTGVRDVLYRRDATGRQFAFAAWRAPPADEHAPLDGAPPPARRVVVAAREGVGGRLEVVRIADAYDEALAALVPSPGTPGEG